MILDNNKIALEYIDILGVIVMVLDKNGIVSSINQKGASVIGLPKEEIIGKNWFEHFLIEERKEAIFSYFNMLKGMKKGSTSKMNGYILTAKKELRLIAWTNTVLMDDNGNLLGLLTSGEDITKINKAHKKLEENEKRFRELFEEAPYGYQSLDADGNFIEVNKRWLDLFGYKKEEVIGQWFGNFLSPEAKEAFKVRFEIFKANGEIHSEFPLRTKNGDYILVGFDGQIGYKEDMTFKQTHCLLQDITEINIAQEKLVASEKKYRELVDNMPLGMIIQEPIVNHLNHIVDFKFVLCNQQFCNQFDLIEDDVVGNTLFSVFPKLKEVVLPRISSLIHQKKTLDFETDRLSTGKYFRIISYNMKGENDIVLIFEDITSKKEVDMEVEYLSKHDYLTNLYNRRAFLEAFTRMDKEENYPLGVMMLDVNGLKIINDAFGHSIGDIVLTRLADTLKEVFREEDALARLGGDEFGVIMPNVDTEIVEELKKELKSRLEGVQVNNMELSVAAGYEFVDLNKKKSLDEVLKEAENHMYRYKISEGISVRNKAIKAIFNTLNEKYIVERVHSQRVSEFCKQIGIAMGMKQEDVRELELSGLFHDIGKISIPDAILNKPTKLTDEEFTLIKKHPEFSYQILRAADEYSDLAINALYHHERIDGKGYPKGLAGNDIPLFSRIINVADAFEAMTSERPYKKVVSKEDAIQELLRCAGTQFDVNIVDIFVNKVL